MIDPESKIAENLQRVRQRIRSATEDAGRDASDVTLIGVTKYVGLPEVQALIAAGCYQLGESRPQSLWEKAEGIEAETSIDSSQVAWHLIGHLQKNKVRRSLASLSLPGSGQGLIHSVDSLRLLRSLDEVAGELAAASGSHVAGQRVGVLLEVNISGDSEKHGWTPDELKRVIASLDEFSHLEIRGLMTMASREGGPEVARRNFADLRKLRDVLQQECPEDVVLAELSMGMSGDLEAAIAEGATLVRVGRALFEGVER